MFGSDIMTADPSLVTDIVAYEDAMRRREISQMYRDISMLHTKMRHIQSSSSPFSLAGNTMSNGSLGHTSSAWKSSASGDGEWILDLQHAKDPSYSAAHSSWMTGDHHHGGPCRSSMYHQHQHRPFGVQSSGAKRRPTQSSSRRSSTPKQLSSRPTTISPTGIISKHGLIHGLNRELDIYYCKHCGQSWPTTFFRNTQQFGAHCSNCSRQRKVKHPRDLNVDGEPTSSDEAEDMSLASSSSSTPPSTPSRRKRASNPSPKRSSSDDASKPSPRRRKKQKKASSSATAKAGTKGPRDSSSAGGRKIKHGCDKVRGIYHCKHCETSWPIDYFRNPQQFGAHCSNCSRQRQVREPSKVAPAPSIAVAKPVAKPVVAKPAITKKMSMAVAKPSATAAGKRPPVSPMVAAAARAIVASAPSSLSGAVASSSSSSESVAKPKAPLAVAARGKRPVLHPMSIHPHAGKPVMNVHQAGGLDSEGDDDDMGGEVIGLASDDLTHSPFKPAPSSSSSRAIVDELFGSAALFC